METTKQLVIGIDLGSADSYVAYVGKGAIDVVQNEVSQRKTPTLVGFTDRERLLGDAALSQIKSNVKNSCRNFKHYLGQRWDSPVVDQERFWSTCSLEADRDGCIGCSVNYKGEPTTFSATDLTAMFLTKLKNITEAWCQGVVADVVIGVPSYFADFQRQALLDASQIAGLNVLRIMNEHTATALEYGYFRSDTFDPEKPATVAFCQMGHVGFSVSVVQFRKGRFTVLCERNEKVGGRDMDECLIRTFAQQFEKKTGCDLLSNKKALFKLEDAVTKTKKILSANSESSISCECLMEDHDFASSIDRKDFLKMCEPMMKKVSDTLEAAKAACGLPVSAIDSVEVCGGASRVPWVKEMCSKVFGGKELSTTMNADECVARGCGIQAALLSPLYRVREFKVEDTSRFPVSLTWKSPGRPASGNGDVDMTKSEDRSAVVFPQNSLMNIVKVVTFFRKDGFELQASMAGDQASDSNKNDLGTYVINMPTQEQEKKVKVKLALTMHGTFAVKGATLVEESGEAQETAAAPVGEAGAPEGSGNGSENSGKDGQKGPDAKPAASRKRPLRRTDLAVTAASGCPGLAEAELKRRREREEQMISETRLIEETNNKKNELESYILTMRSSIQEGAKYGAYITAADREALNGQLEKAEDWLYDQYEGTRELFANKLAELKVLGDPAVARYQDEIRRSEVAAQLRQAAEGFKAVSQKPGPKQKHVDKEKLQSLSSACDDALGWLKAMEAKQAALPKHESPVLASTAIEARSEELNKLADTVLEGGKDGAAAATASPENEEAAAPGGEVDGRNAVDVD